MERIAVLVSHSAGRNELCGAKILAVDELMAEIAARVRTCGVMGRWQFRKFTLYCAQSNSLSAAITGSVAPTTVEELLLSPAPVKRTLPAQTVALSNAEPRNRVR